jgi:hypothetical protein
VIMTRKNRITQYVLPLVAVLLLAAASYGQTSSTPPTGSPLGQVTFSQNCGFLSGVGSGVGIGITFDGTNLWYSCYDSKLSTDPNQYDLFKADPKTGTVLAAYDIAGGMGAIAYDQKRNVIWAGEGGGIASNVNQIIEISLDANQNVVATTCATAPCPLFTVAFPDLEAYAGPFLAGYGPADIVDGLAIDTITDTLYVHYDFTTAASMYNVAPGTATTPFGKFLGQVTESPGIPLGVPTISAPDNTCVLSGLAIGGSTLLEGSDYCDHVWAVDKTSQTASFDFDLTTAVSGFSGFDEKTLTCDPQTFHNVADAVWVKEPFDPQTAFAFTIPDNTCGIGGAAPTGKGHKPKKK